jgi:hypothetical protein
MIGKPEAKRLRRWWEDNIRMDLTETECEAVYWIQTSGIKVHLRATVHTVMKHRVP